MKKMSTIILTCLVSILVMAAGCAGTSTTATPAATATPVAAASDPWSGTWETRGSTTIAYQTLGVLTLTRTGPSVTGIFSNSDSGNGTLSGTIYGNQLTGTWTVNYPLQSDSGTFVFVLSDDKNSFTGAWVSASDTAITLSTSPEFWNGVRR